MEKMEKLASSSLRLWISTPRALTPVWVHLITQTNRGMVAVAHLKLTIRLILDYAEFKHLHFGTVFLVIRKLI